MLAGQASSRPDLAAEEKNRSFMICPPGKAARIETSLSQMRLQGFWQALSQEGPAARKKCLR